ncbi:threonine aldolase family protein [Formosa maritima]|uniref:Threonine aldolase n=1 Tax=Formosa maritima TaxID=2592046 RepID=A0A5D0G4P7_9FLAO|nr:beta-eliminating lyase-related protein [Formosa maritima]TYA53828.1 threonine aldolase [Formosa maritima]
MKKNKKCNNRREFLKTCGLSTIPFLMPTASINAFSSIKDKPIISNKNQPIVNFIFDGFNFSPQEYIEKLTEINLSNPISKDFYGSGGETELLEKSFAKITGKEKAIYLPTGTMANQIAIYLLNGNNTKVIVPENSHVYRDEADAAQSVFNKRLIPVETDNAYFNLSELEKTIKETNNNEVFKSGLGTVVIENPIRRANGIAVPIETIQKISNYCKQKGYKMHLDGARLHIASAFTNVSVLEYASYFDTVYISLYKYLNAAGGAILCGDAEIIDQVAHQIKIHGGAAYKTWPNTSVALHYLQTIEEKLKQVKEITSILIPELNKIDGISITKIENGTNLYDLKLSKNINSEKLESILYKEHYIWISSANQDGITRFAVNESLLSRDIQDIIQAWKQSIIKARN